LEFTDLSLHPLGNEGDERCFGFATEAEVESRQQVDRVLALRQGAVQFLVGSLFGGRLREAAREEVKLAGDLLAYR